MYICPPEILLSCFLQLLTVLEGALKRDYLSSNFETTAELLNSNTQDFADRSSIACSGSAAVLPWVPNTSAAVTLRLLDLDSSLSYTPDQKAGLNKEREAGDFIVSVLPCDYCIIFSWYLHDLLVIGVIFAALIYAKC